MVHCTLVKVKGNIHKPTATRKVLSKLMTFVRVELIPALAAFGSPLGLCRGGMKSLTVPGSEAGHETPHPAAHGRHPLPGERAGIFLGAPLARTGFSLSRGERVAEGRGGGPHVLLVVGVRGLLAVAVRPL